jgi:hypothetical protein
MSSDIDKAVANLEHKDENVRMRALEALARACDHGALCRSQEGPVAQFGAPHRR